MNFDPTDNNFTQALLVMLVTNIISAENMSWHLAYQERRTNGRVREKRLTLLTLSIETPPLSFPPPVNFYKWNPSPLGPELGIGDLFSCLFYFHVSMIAKQWNLLCNYVLKLYCETHKSHCNCYSWAPLSWDYFVLGPMPQNKTFLRQNIVERTNILSYLADLFRNHDPKLTFKLSFVDWMT